MSQTFKGGEGCGRLLTKNLAPKDYGELIGDWKAGWLEYEDDGRAMDQRVRNHSNLDRGDSDGVAQKSPFMPARESAEGRGRRQRKLDTLLSNCTE